MSAKRSAGSSLSSTFRCALTDGRSSCWAGRIGARQPVVRRAISTATCGAATSSWASSGGLGHADGTIEFRGDLRLRAGEAHLAADDPAAAVRLLRRVLCHDIWWLRLDEAHHVLRSLGENWPPEIASELGGWRWCTRAATDPSDAASGIQSALEEEHAFDLDEQTAASRL